MITRFNPVVFSTLKLGAVALGMFGFGYAMIPLYKTMCDWFGINGIPKNEAQTQTMQIDRSRVVKVEMLTLLNKGLAIEFMSTAPIFDLNLGEYKTVSVRVKNNTGRVLHAKAMPQVAPWDAAKYVVKTECFCFKEQTFQKDEIVEMPVRLTLAPELPKHIKTVTLSYTFFDADIKQ